MNAYEIIGANFRFIYADWLKNIEFRKKHFVEERLGLFTGDYDFLPFKKNLHALNDLCQRENAQFLVVFIPDSVQINTPSLQKINQIVSDTCNEKRISFLDMTPIFEKESDVTSLYLFPVDPHTSVKGNKIIANAVYNRIKEGNFLLDRH